MKTKHKQIYAIASNEPPVVEVDTEACAAYIRFAKGKVARTKVEEQSDQIVTLDFDKDGRLLGIEMIGVQEFTLNSLLTRIPSLRYVPTGEARYVAAPKMQPA